MPDVPPIDWTVGCPPMPRCLTTGIGYPGTVEFCECLVGLQGEIQSLIQGLIAWAGETITADRLSALIERIPDSGSVTNPGGYVFDGIKRLLLVSLRQAKPYLDGFLGIVRCTLGINASIQTAGNPGVAALLIICKWVLDAIKEWEIGTDALVWLIDRIRLDFGPLEDLLDRLIHYYMPVEPPSPAEATEAWLQGQITPRVRDCVWQLHGINPSMFLPFATASAERLSPEEVIQLGRRHDMRDGDIERELRARGWQRDEDRIGKLELYWELPTIGDHLHWLSRNVDDHDYVKRFGLLDGFSTDEFINRTFPELHYETQTDTHGRDFWARYGHDLTARGMKPEYAAYHYAAHWIQPSPEQMRQFVYRLRPNAAGVEHPFTAEDYDRILAEQDYAPLARQWFADTLPMVPALTYLIGMYQQGIIDDAALQSYHQDLGYTEVDSARFVGVDRIRKAQFRSAKYNGWTPHAIGNAYVVGRIDDAQVDFLMGLLGADRQESAALREVATANFERSIFVRARSRAIWSVTTRVSQALDVGTIDADEAARLLRQIGFPDQHIQTLVQAQIAAGSTKIVRQTVAHIRHAVVDGYISSDQATAMLVTAGVNIGRIAQYMSMWAIQNTPRRKRRTAKEIIADLGAGMMELSEAYFRLRNLGYDNADSMLYLADAQRQLLQRQSRAQTAAERAAQKAAKEQEKLARQAEAQARKLRAEAMRGAGKGTLIKWLKDGVITPAQFAARMASGGYSSADTVRYMRDAVQHVSTGTLTRWAKAEVIGESEYDARLIKLGWSAGDVGHYNAEVAAAIAAKKKKTASGTGGKKGAGGGTAPPGGPPGGAG